MFCRCLLRLAYYKARKLPVHLLPLEVAKLRKLIEQDLLGHVPLGGSKWTSSFLVIRESEGEICTCGDYNIGVHHKVCSDSYPISNVQVGFHAQVGMNVFTKVHLKTT